MGDTITNPEGAYGLPRTRGNPLGTRPYLTVPNEWGSNWERALKTTHRRLARVKVMGDSIAAGYIQSDGAHAGWAAKLVKKLQAQYGYGGTGLTTMAWSDVASPSTGIITSTGPWVLSNFGYGGKVLSTTTVGATLTLPKQYGKTLVVHYTKGPAFGEFRIDIRDKGTGPPLALTTVNANAGSAGTDFETVSTGAALSGEYSVIITVLSTGAAIEAIDCYNDRGVAMHNLAVPASTTDLVVQPLFTGASAFFHTYGGEGLLRVPSDLNIVSWGVNDRTAAVTQTNYQTRLLAAANWAALSVKFSTGPGRAGTTLFEREVDPVWGDVIMVSTHCGNDAAANYFQYVNWMKEVASAQQYAHANLHALFPAAVTAVAADKTLNYFSQGGLVTPPDYIHPNAAGYARYADLLEPLVIPR